MKAGKEVYGESKELQPIISDLVWVSRHTGLDAMAGNRIFPPSKTT